MTHELILYGSGKRCEVLCEVLQKTDTEIIVVVDSDPNKWGCLIEGFSVKSPEEIRKFSNIDFCITVSNSDAIMEIRDLLLQVYHRNSENEISYNKLILKAFKENRIIKKNISQKKVSKNRLQSILFDSCNGFGLGGVEAWTIGVSEALIEDGVENIFIISDNGIYDVPPLLKHQVIYADINHRKRFSLNSVLNIVKQILKKLPCKVITRDVDDVMIAAYLIKCYYPEMIEIISVIHDGLEINCREYMDFKECSDYYIAVSQDIKNNMIQWGIVPDKITCMTCPFYCEQTLIRTYTYDSSLPIRIGYAGRMDGMEHSQKRMDLLLKLVEVLVEKNLNFILELAGDGVVRKEMENFISLNHLNERVKFLGILKRSEIPSFWKKQDICINLANYEGRCISKLEAMANGAVPVITDTSGAKEDIADGVNGYIVPLGDYHTMADRIIYLAEHRKCLKKMGSLAHDEVYPKSLMETHVKFWEEIFLHKL